MLFVCRFDLVVCYMFVQFFFYSFVILYDLVFIFFSSFLCAGLYIQKWHHSVSTKILVDNWWTKHRPFNHHLLQILSTGLKGKGVSILVSIHQIHIVAHSLKRKCPSFTSLLFPVFFHQVLGSSPFPASAVRHGPRQQNLFPASPSSALFVLVSPCLSYLPLSLCHFAQRRLFSTQGREIKKKTNLVAIRREYRDNEDVRNAGFFLAFVRKCWARLWRALNQWTIKQLNL